MPRRPRRILAPVLVLVVMAVLPFFAVRIGWLLLPRFVREDSKQHKVVARRPAPRPQCEMYEVHATVSRILVDQWLANTDDLMRAARIVPTFDHREGFKLYAIRPDSPFAALGIHNGDTIHEVNDFTLTSADDALSLYQSLRFTDHITIKLVRGGCPLTVSVTIV